MASDAAPAATVEEAVARLRGDDPRPLMIMRDCDGCPNKEGDLLARSLVDERVLLATEWFHCVRFGHDVWEDENHPLAILFKSGSIGRPHHVLITSWDAKTVVEVNRAGAKDLWKAQRKVLKKDYKGNIDRSVNGMLKLLSAFDTLDNRQSTLEQQLQAKQNRATSGSQRIKKLEAELEELREEREELFEEETKLRALALVTPPALEKQQEEAAGL